MGSRLLILGHYYQRDEVLSHADSVGDSLELSRRAAAEKRADKIVFCGVHFMAETADILTGPGQSVYMPEPAAGCPMADMAEESAVRKAWDILKSAGGPGWLPVVYVNSTAPIKALCGEWGGSACTSSNASKVFKWVLEQGCRIFFLPDRHLGVNTAHDLGMNDGDIALYDPRKPSGGLTPEQIAGARVIVWNGFCCVHTKFRVPLVREIRDKWPTARIIVHPETPREVAMLADARGSTAQIIKYVEQATEGSTIFVGTESRLVERLAAQLATRGVTVKWLAHSVCRNMSLITEESLARLLVEWPDGHRISVPPDVAGPARSALERMLAV